MLDFNHIISNMGAGGNIQEFRKYSNTSSNGQRPQWQTWVKPRGAKMVYIMAVGGGSAGIDGLVVSAGQAGGGGGAIASVLIPAMMIPDELYVWVGPGGWGGNHPAFPGATYGGYPTIVSIEPFNGQTGAFLEYPDTTVKTQGVLLRANGACVVATQGPTSAGGTVSTIGNMCLAGRGAYSFYAGSTGAAAGAQAVVSSTGSISSGGGGGGGSSNTGAGSAGGGVASIVNATFLTQYYYPAIAGLTGATGATPAEAPKTYGYQTMTSWYYNALGGPGGGGASSTAGGASGGGGPGGFPGCGGGGGAGTTTNNPTPSRGGPGGDGFCYIYCW